MLGSEVVKHSECARSSKYQTTAIVDSEIVGSPNVRKQCYTVSVCINVASLSCLNYVLHRLSHTFNHLGLVLERQRPHRLNGDKPVAPWS